MIKGILQEGRSDIPIYQPNDEFIVLSSFPLSFMYRCRNRRQGGFNPFTVKNWKLKRFVAPAQPLDTMLNKIDLNHIPVSMRLIHVGLAVMQTLYVPPSPAYTFPQYQLISAVARVFRGSHYAMNPPL